MSFAVLISPLKVSVKGLLQCRIIKQSVVCCCKFLHSDGYNIGIDDILHKKKVVIPTLHTFKTEESNPTNHKMRHEGLLYTLSKDAYQRLASDITFRIYRKQADTFQEACLMVRKPAIEIFHLMKHLDLTLPIPKIILYGHLGCGKSMTLLHTMHYAAKNDWFIIQTPWPSQWVQWYTEIANSSYKPGRIDMPVQAKEFLQHMIQQNETILKQFKTQFRYQWTKRESAEIGTPLIDLAQFGTTRIKFADDVVGAIFKEIKQLAKEQQVKVLLAVDGINGFYGLTRMRTVKKAFKDIQQANMIGEYLPAADVSLIENLKMLLQPDMTNSICVATVDTNVLLKDQRKDIVTPNYLLGKEGFKSLDPFIPIHVPEYSEKEALSMIEYYIEKQWIINAKGKTDEGKKQIMFLSNKNPRQLRNICQSV